MKIENFNFVKDGATKLPPSFRFQPTDEEIVFQYLLRKTFSCPLPASIIPVLNVCNIEPWDLPGDPDQDRYFFCNKELKYPNKNRSNRTTRSGYWKPTGVDKQISSSKRKPIVGKRKTLVFHEGKPPHGIRTNWIMHEYRLTLSRTSSCCPHQQNPTFQIGHWVVCHILMKKRSTKSDIGREQAETRVLDSKMDNNVETDSTSSSCDSLASDSSILTEVSSICRRS